MRKRRREKKRRTEMKKVIQRADQAEGSEGDFSCRPDPSLTKAGAALVNRSEVVVLDWCGSRECVLYVHARQERSAKV